MRGDLFEFLFTQLQFFLSEIAVTHGVDGDEVYMRMGYLKPDHLHGKPFTGYRLFKRFGHAVSEGH